LVNNQRHRAIPHRLDYSSATEQTEDIVHDIRSSTKPHLHSHVQGADELGNICGGLTGGCDANPSGGCLQTIVKKTAGKP
jgi:hypothetical protein